MNRLLAIAVLICVANVAEGAAKPNLLRRMIESKLPINFDGLGDYLSEKVASADSEANLEAIKANIGSLRGGVERAAQIVLTIEKAQQCDDQLLALLKEAQPYELTPYGSKRVTLVIRPHLNRVLELCTDYLEYNVKKTYKQLIGNNETMREFVDVFSADNEFRSELKGNIPVVLYEKLLGKTDRVVSETTLGRMMRELANDDSSLMVKRMVESPLVKGKEFAVYNYAKDKFRPTFQKYLKEPCQLFTSSLSRFFDAAITLVNIQSNLHDFLAQRSPQFKLIAWRNNACRFVLSLDEQQLSSMESYEMRETL